VTPRWLRERHFGAFQGRTFAEIEVELPDHAWHWRKRTPDWTPPDGGESFGRLRDRIVATVDELAARHPGQQIVMVAHGGVLDILYRAATRLDLQAPRTWALTNTAVNRLLWTPARPVSGGLGRHHPPGHTGERRIVFIKRCFAVRRCVLRWEDAC
jgi:broad specificity phosphatase PhoE